MGIYIKMIYGDSDVLARHRDAFHNAIRGQKIYIDSEIAIVEEDRSSFTLCIGRPNRDNVRLNIENIDNETTSFTIDKE